MWQRPQQLLSRLSKRTRVLFVEEPMYLDDVNEPRLDITTPMANVCRVVPMLPLSMRDSYDQSMSIIRALLRREMTPDGRLGDRYDRPIQWFYTPMAGPAMIGAFGEVAVVYDCMDELSLFRFAPTELSDREKLLMAEADVVFAGGAKLAEAKARLHPNVHFFGCGVDSAHFAAALSDGIPVPRDLGDVTGPVIGYYGVIDERLDYGLLGTLASALPNVSLFMIGPVVKVAPSELPQAPNIRWLGQRPYEELPAYVRRFDVCLMPFALNDATAFINPTKTLEYMAAGKAVVSTAISDVVRQFSTVVHVAGSHAEFVEQVREAIARPDVERIEYGRETARTHSWENIVRRMERLLDAAVDARAMRTAADAGRGARSTLSGDDGASGVTRGATTAAAEDTP